MDSTITSRGIVRGRDKDARKPPIEGAVIAVAKKVTCPGIVQCNQDGTRGEHNPNSRED